MGDPGQTSGCGSDGVSSQYSMEGVRGSPSHLRGAFLWKRQIGQALGLTKDSGRPKPDIPSSCPSTVVTAVSDCFTSDVKTEIQTKGEYPGYDEIATCEVAAARLNEKPSDNATSEDVKDVKADQSDTDSIEEKSTGSATRSSSGEADTTGESNISINECGVCGKQTTIAPGDRLEEEVVRHGVVLKSTVLMLDDAFWIECDVCQRWFHGICVDVEEHEAPLIDKFHCPKCTLSHGNTTMFPFHAPHRHRYYDEEEKNQKMEVGSKRWIEKFINKEHLIQNASENDVIICKDGDEFMDRFEKDKDWKEIYLVKDPRGMQLSMPADGEFNTQTLIDIFGEDYAVDTVDVYRQQTVSMRLGAFHKKFTSSDRPRLYNILSLEFSRDDKMRSLVIPPLKVLEISFVHRMWPDPRDPINYDPYVDHLPNSNVLKRFHVPEEAMNNRPDVALFCLCGMAGSYTDFHIDFGGSSVWYHIYEGEKVFYVAPPTSANLRSYRHHQTASTKTEFLGDSLENLRRVVISKGNTLMIPSGWIHAVYTPVDSIVFGGNFLHELNIPMQLKVYDIELDIKSKMGTEDKFLFPQFEFIHEHVSVVHIQEMLREAIDDHLAPSPLFVKAAEALLKSFKSWEMRGASESFGYPLRENIKKLEKLLEKIRKIEKQDSGRKKKMKKKRGSTEGTSDDDFMLSASPKKKPKKRASAPESMTVPLGTNVSHMEAEVVNPSSSAPPEDGKSEDLERPNSPQELSVILRRTTGEEYQSEIVGKGYIDEVNMPKMFARRSSSGRQPKPSGWLENYAGDALQKEARRIEERGEQPKVRAPVEYTAKMDAAIAAEERELEKLDSGKKKSRKQAGTSKTASKLSGLEKSQPKKCPPSTSKQRLAKKIGIRM